MRLSSANCKPLVLALSLLAYSNVAVGGMLSPDIRIASHHLNYDVQYWVYYPTGIKNSDQLPTLYVTDGNLYLQHGKLHGLLDEEIEARRIKPIIAVFIDPRDPDNWKINRRAWEFACNAKYVQFFTEELIPNIEQQFPVSKRREDRTILGLSFGGMNAACFGLMAHDTFGGIAMQSPVYHQLVPDLLNRYRNAPQHPLRMFLSTGKPKLGTGRSDGTMSARRLRKVLADKGYDLIYKEVHHGHNWENWGPLQTEVLQTFFKK